MRSGRTILERPVGCGGVKERVKQFELHDAPTFAGVIILPEEPAWQEHDIATLLDLIELEEDPNESVVWAAELCRTSFLQFIKNGEAGLQAKKIRRAMM